ncbi:flavodoxin [Pectinatus frisingensis]|uniref:flavodoxin n=1 Tax=Pectinatus frisingensis TaxID=865 RepID=UPI003D805953
MGKIAIVYWSASGNTKQMADAIADGINRTGEVVEIFSAADFPIERVVEFEKIAFGCPAMGVEELEQDEFEPVFTELEMHLTGKIIALFGSYDWGDGEWMRTWQHRINDDKAVLFEGKGIIVHGTPNKDDKQLCRAFGQRLAQEMINKR